MKRIIFILAILISTVSVIGQVNNVQQSYSGFYHNIKTNKVAFIDTLDIGGFFITKDSAGNAADNINIFPTVNPAIVWIRVTDNSSTLITSENNTYLFEDSINDPPVSFPAGTDTTYWMIGGAPTGIFVGHDFDVAVYVNGVFDVFIDPVVNDWGLTLDDNFWHQYNGSTWPRRNPPDWKTVGNFGGGILGSTNPAPVFMRYNNLNRIILQNTGVRFPALGGVSSGLMGLNATGLARNIQIDTNTISLDSLAVGVLSSNLTWQRTIDNGRFLDKNNNINVGFHNFTFDSVHFFNIYARDSSSADISYFNINPDGFSTATIEGTASSVMSSGGGNVSSYVSYLSDTAYSNSEVISLDHFKFDKDATGDIFPAGVSPNTKIFYVNPPIMGSEPDYMYVSDNDTIKKYPFSGGGGGITQEQLDDTASAIREDFPVGGGGSANVYAPLIKSGDTIMQRFNVLHYGAKGDSVTNDASSIQAAINAADAAGGGVVYFPKPAIYYNIGSAINVTYNSQLYIPVSTNTSARNHIILMGEAAPNFSPVGAAIPTALTTKAIGGTRLKSTITTGAAGAAIIGTALGGSSIPNQTNLTVENLSFEVKNNPAGAGPVIGGINWENGAEIFIDKVVVYVDTAGIFSTLPTNDVSGIETPDNLSGSSYKISNSLVAGFRHGYKISEHVTMDNAGAWFNYNAIYGKIGYHASYIARACFQWNRNDIYFGGTAFFKCFTIRSRTYRRCQ